MTKKETQKTKKEPDQAWLLLKTHTSTTAKAL